MFLLTILYHLCLLSSSMSILCLCVIKLKNGHRLTLKSLFSPINPICWVSNERYDQKTFLLQYYSIDFSPIKIYRPFCFYCLSLRRQRFSPCNLTQLSVHMSVLLSVCQFFFLSLSFCWFVSPSN